MKESEPKLDVKAVELEYAPYNPDLFAGREWYSRQMHRKVDEGLAGYSICKPLIHLWGEPGTGKTWFLEHLKRKYQFSPEQKVEKDGTFCLSADFDAVELRFSIWEHVRTTRLLGNFVGQMESQLGEKLQEVAGGELAKFKAEQEKLELISEGVELTSEKYEVESLTKSFVTLVARLNHHYVPVFLFDTIEKLDEDSFFWLEKNVIEPIVQTKQAIVVVAGRKEIPRWREFNNRQQLTVWGMGVFNKEETLEQLARGGHGGLGDVIHSLSFGSPYVNQVLGKELHQLAEGQQPLPANFEQMHHREILMLLGAVEKKLLTEVPENHKKVLRMLSTLRRFNVVSARHMLGSLLNIEYLQKNDFYFLRLFEDLEDTNLVLWNADQRGYVVVPTLRQIINLLKKSESLTAFHKQHTEAFNLYNYWMDDTKYPHDRGVILPEALYHLANMFTGKKTSDVKKQNYVSQFLDLALNTAYFTTDSVNALFESLYRDQELFNTSNQLYDQIIKRAGRFRNEVRGV